VNGIEVLRYEPKDRREIRRAFNNIYAKNFPPTWDESKLRSLFSQYGDIKSLILMKTEAGQPFAFVCYEHADDRNYGPKCAMKAV